MARIAEKMMSTSRRRRDSLSRGSFNSLRIQLFLWIALPVAVSLLAMSLIEIRGHEEAMTRLVQQQADLAARALAELLDAQVEQRQLLLQQWSMEYSADAASSPPLHTAFSSGLATIPSARALMSPLWAVSSQVLAFADGIGQTQTPDVLTYYDVSSGQWLLIQAVPGVLNAEGSAPVLLGATPIRAFVTTELETIADSVAYEQLRVGLPNGEMLFESLDFTHIAAELGHVAHGQEEWVVSEVTVPTTGWQVTVRTDWRRLVPPLLNFGNAVLAIVALAVVLSLFSAYLGLRTIVWPLQRLNDNVSQVGLGDFLSIQQPVGGVSEIEELHYVVARMTEQIRQYQNELQSYIGAMTLGQEEERRRLARELHDDTVQNLIALNHQIELVKRDLSRDTERASVRLQSVRELVTSTIDDLRRQIYALRPLYLEDLGFIPALETLIQQVCQDHHLIGEVAITGDVDAPISTARQISAYRIAQEVLQNVVKHANATSVNVALHIHLDYLTLTIRDNGKGFVMPSRPSQLAQAGHFGLMGMKERAELHGGYIKVDSKIEHGTKVTVHLPSKELAATQSRDSI